MDYREYRKKYGSAQTPASEDTGDNLSHTAKKYKNGGGAASETGSVTRNYRSVRSGRKRYGARSKNSAAAKGVIAAIIGLTVLLIAAVGIMVFTNRSLQIPDYLARKVVAEAGRTSMKASDFLKDKSHKAEFAKGTDYSFDKVGTYSIRLLIDDTDTYTVKLEVQDTVAPTALPKTVTVRKGHTPKPQNCVSNIKDATDVEVTFAETPDVSALGSHTVKILLTDAGGNTTVISSTVNVVEDADILTYTVDLEAGNPFPDIFEFVGEDGYGKYTGDVTAVNTAVPGKHEMGINVDGNLYTVYVNVRDTLSPEGTVSPITFYNDKYPTAAQFFTSMTDNTAVTASFASQPNWNAGEKVPVKLELTDLGGNKTAFETYAVHKTDNVPPVMTVLKKSLEYTVGDPAITWRSNVTATDNSGEDVELMLDYSSVDLSVAGNYTVYYVARDAAGNESRSPASLEVIDVHITLEALNEEYIKPIVKEIIKFGMTDQQTAEAVFKYLTANNVNKLKYTESTPHDDWVKRAYLALSGNRKGDCFVFASVANAIFKYLGYETVMVERSEEAKIRAGGTHFWVMVNFNTDDPLHDHWYHFDGTPQAVRDNYYMMTTHQTKVFTEWRDVKLKALDLFYQYDEDKYPTSETKVAVRFANAEFLKYLSEHGLTQE